MNTNGRAHRDPLVQQLYNKISERDEGMNNLQGMLEKIAVIACGNIGEVLVSTLLGNERMKIKRTDIVASVRCRDRADELKKTYGITSTTSNAGAARNAGLVFLTAKPGVLVKTILPQLRDKIRTDALVISTAAGVPIEVIASVLKHKHVIRSMPNTPAKIGRGVTVWTAHPSCTPDQLELSRTVFQALGREFCVDANDEQFVDMATALSGTGPFNVFFLMEAHADAGVHMGLPRHLAEQLTIATFKGAVLYAEKSGNDFAYLKNEVMTPNGTTTRTNYCFHREGVYVGIMDGVLAAHERTLEINRQSSEAIANQKKEG
jgi:pyrroline-5-carboxylate reductase